VPYQSLILSTLSRRGQAAQPHPAVGPTRACARPAIPDCDPFFQRSACYPDRDQSLPALDPFSSGSDLHRPARDRLSPTATCTVP